MSARGGVELMAAGEVAALLKVHPYTVTRWGASGRLVTSRTAGGHRRFFAAEVRALARGEPRERARELGLAERERLMRGAGG